MLSLDDDEIKVELTPVPENNLRYLKDLFT